MGDNCVFLLEDSRDDLEYIKTILEKSLNVTVLVSDNADETIPLLTRNISRIKAFVLDIEMVGQKYSGIDVALAIRNNPECVLTPIIFLTSYSHFGKGALKQIHYYDFISKSAPIEQLITVLQQALGLEKKTPSFLDKYRVIINGRKFQSEIVLDDISCIEQFGNELIVTDYFGKETRYLIKSHAFESICDQIAAFPDCPFEQIHRSVIINVHRIKSIDMEKNTGRVTLFNVSDMKPAGKTYLHKLLMYIE